MNVTAFSLAERYLGIAEIPGEQDHPLILWWHSLCTMRATADEVPWCSSFVNGMAWELSLPRSKSALARSWLGVGTRIPLEQAWIGFDVVVLKRGRGEQPGPENLTAPGHVGFFAGYHRELVEVLGGNQGNRVSLARFPCASVLAVQRIHVEAD